MPIRIIIILTILILAVINDRRNYKIPNNLIIAGIAMGIILNVYSFLILRSDFNIIEYLLGFIIPFVLLIPVFAVGGIGAGDIKLMCVLGLVVGRQIIIPILINSMIITGVLCVVNCITTLLKKNGELTTAYIFGRAYSGLHKIHLTYAILIGTIMTLIMRGGI